jgi:hypothetical protein
VAGEQDGIIWYCDTCGKELHQLLLDCQDIKTQLKQALDAFNADLVLRTCTKLSSCKFFGDSVHLGGSLLREPQWLPLLLEFDPF